MKNSLIAFMLLVALGLIASCNTDLSSFEELDHEVQSEGVAAYSQKINNTNGNSDFNTLLPLFEDYLLEKYNTTDYTINSLDIEQKDDKKIFAIVFEIVPTGIIESVMLGQSYSTLGNPTGPTTVVTCSGPCKCPYETCRERYVRITDSYECTCEGDCSMTITKKQ